MRGFIAEKILRRRKVDDRALFEGVVQIGLTPGSGDQLARWTEVLKAQFDSLRLDIAEPLDQPRLDENGRVALADRDGALILTVEDDGVGFDMAVVTAGAGLGGLSERASPSACRAVEPARGKVVHAAGTTG